MPEMAIHLSAGRELEQLISEKAWSSGAVARPTLQTGLCFRQPVSSRSPLAVRGGDPAGHVVASEGPEDVESQHFCLSTLNQAACGVDRGELDVQAREENQGETVGSQRERHLPRAQVPGADQVAGGNVRVCRGVELVAVFLHRAGLWQAAEGVALALRERLIEEQPCEERICVLVAVAVVQGRWRTSGSAAPERVALYPEKINGVQHVVRERIRVQVRIAVVPAILGVRRVDVSHREGWRVVLFAAGVELLERARWTPQLVSRSTIGGDSAARVRGPGGELFQHLDCVRCWNWRTPGQCREVQWRQVECGGGGVVALDEHGLVVKTDSRRTCCACPFW